MADVQVVHADCIDALATLDEASVDAIVTDPPYGLEFMGRDWDRLGDDPVSKSWDSRGRRSDNVPQRSPNDPGGRHGVSYKQQNPRCRVCGRAMQGRDTAKGFKVCSCQQPQPYMPNIYPVRMQHWHQQWAAEALRVLKPGGHLLAFGGTRTHHRLTAGIEDAGFEIRDTIAWLYGSGFPKSLQPRNGMRSLPRSTTREQYRTWHRAVRTYATGTALKPSYEPIVVARKPLAGTVAANVLEHGTGALNIAACRIEHGADVDLTREQRQQSDTAGFGSSGMPAGHVQPTYNGAGRWPANVVLDPDAAAQLDAQTGTLTSGTLGPDHTDRGKDAGRLGAYSGRQIAATFGGDSGGASRFYYTAKASSADRGPGNTHPTVKPVELMRWLIRLVTPPDGLIVDPFAGSGTTGVAAVIEGRRCLLIEREAEYVEIIDRRLAQPIQPTLGGIA